MSDRPSPLGLGCTLQKLHDGRYFVSPQAGYQRGHAPTQEKGYVGEGPFTVYRRTDRDVVECKPIDERKDSPEPTPPLNYYCFSLAGDWTIVGTSAFADGTYYPLLGQDHSDPTAWNPLGNYQVAGDYGPSATREFHGSFIGTTVEDTTLSQMAPYDEGDTVFTLGTLYLGKWLISSAATAPAGYAPMEPAAPDGPWYKSQAGTFSVKFDVWQIVIVTRDGVEVSRTETKTSTQTIDGLTVSGSESADDYESWASVACDIDFTANKTYPFGSGGAGFNDFDETAIEIRNLRILRTA